MFRVLAGFRGAGASSGCAAADPSEMYAKSPSPTTDYQKP